MVGLARRATPVGSSESDPSSIWVEDHFESTFVDHDVMVEPAENNQLTLVCAATERPRREVMDLKSSVAVAAIGCTSEPHLCE